jgi:hypothetical protein
MSSILALESLKSPENFDAKSNKILPSSTSDSLSFRDFVKDKDKDKDTSLEKSELEPKASEVLSQEQDSIVNFEAEILKNKASSEEDKVINQLEENVTDVEGIIEKIFFEDNLVTTHVSLEPEVTEKIAEDETILSAQDMPALQLAVNIPELIVQEEFEPKDDLSKFETGESMILSMTPSLITPQSFVLSDQEISDNLTLEQNSHLIDINALNEGAPVLNALNEGAPVFAAKEAFSEEDPFFFPASNLNPKASLMQEKEISIVTVKTNESELAINSAEEAIPIKYELPIEIKEEIISKENQTTKLAISSNVKSILADHDQTIHISYLPLQIDKKLNVVKESVNENLMVEEELDILPEELVIDTNLENNNGNTRSKFTSEISNFGGVVETGNNGKLTVSFKDNSAIDQGDIPHKSEQITLSIKEAIATGKTSVTVNMYPKALGSIEIQIQFNTVSGKQVIESIKITADRRDTLDIIQRSEMELRKNLTEVTQSSNDTSLEFNLKHNEGNNSRENYFQNSKERENWMNKFQNTSENQSDKNLNTANSYNDNGYITENSVNVIA